MWQQIRGQPARHPQCQMQHHRQCPRQGGGPEALRPPRRCQPAAGGQQQQGAKQQGPRGDAHHREPVKSQAKRAQRRQQRCPPGPFERRPSATYDGQPGKQQRETAKHRRHAPARCAVGVTARIEKAQSPTPGHQHRAHGSQGEQSPPVFPPGQGRQPQVQQRDVGKQDHGLVLSSRHQGGRQEASRQSQHRDHLGLGAHRREEGRGRDEGHQCERERRGEDREMIPSVGRVGHAVESQDAGGAQRLGEHGVGLTLTEPVARRHQRRCGQVARGHAQGRRHQVALEGVLHKEHDAEEQGQPADPREQFDADKALQRKLAAVLRARSRRVRGFQGAYHGQRRWSRRLGHRLHDRLGRHRWRQRRGRGRQRAQRRCVRLSGGGWLHWLRSGSCVGLGFAERSACALGFIVLRLP